MAQCESSRYLYSLIIFQRRDARSPGTCQGWHEQEFIRWLSIQAVGEQKSIKSTGTGNYCFDPIETCTCPFNLAPFKPSTSNYILSFMPVPLMARQKQTSKFVNSH